MRRALLRCLLGALLALSASGAPGQDLQPIDQASIPPKDYFNRFRDAETQNVIHQVERYHLTEDTFWRAYRSDHLTEARDALEFVLRYVPNHPVALHLMGVISRRLNEPGFPLYYYERALRVFPHRAYTRAQYGKYLLDIGQREAGEVELREAIQSDSTLVTARAWLQESERPTGAIR